MTRRHAAAITAFGLLTAALVPSIGTSVRSAARELPQAQGQRIVAIGDVHGAFEPFVEILQTAGLIDAKQQWIGGSAILVQTGDIFDRGARVRDALDLLMRLEEEAKRAGGRVEALLGNHEVMNLLGDLRDVSPEAYATFVDKRSADRHKRAYGEYLETAKRRSGRGDRVASREEWMAARPPGFVEYVEAMGPRGKYGRWLREHKVVTSVNGIGFMHAGIRPDLPGTLDDVNRTAAREIASWDDTRNAMVTAKLVPPFCTLREAVSAAAAEIERIAAALKAQTPLEEYVTREYVDRLQLLMQLDKMSLIEAEGPLWFRGYAQWPETPENATQLDTLFKRLGVSRFVTGHTPMLPNGRIVSRFDNRVFLIDTGMLAAYFKGRASALEIQDGRVTAIYTDRKEQLLPAKSAHLLRVPLRAPLDDAAASAAVRY